MPAKVILVAGVAVWALGAGVSRCGCDHQFALAVYRASGVSGLVLKRQLDNELLHTIENACAGFSVFSKDLLARVAKQKAAPKLHLTARHKDVLNQLARLPAPGNGEIALALGISEKTVANLVTELRQIFDAPSRNHIILLARQRGFQPVRAVEWVDAA